MQVKSFMLFFIFLLNSVSYGNEFNRSEELSYLSTTNIKFVEDINSIFEYVSLINGVKITTRGTIEISGKGISTKLDLPVQEKDIKLFPERAHKAYVYFHTSPTKVFSKEKIAIENFIVNLSEYHREIKSVGSNLNDVVASLNVAKEKLEKYKVSYTGEDFRYKLLFLIIIIMFGSFYLAFNFLKIKESTIFVYTIMLLSQFVFYGLDWTKLFPSFQLNINQSTVLERFSPLLSLISVLLAIIIPLIIYMAKENKKALKKKK